MSRSLTLSALCGGRNGRRSKQMPAVLHCSAQPYGAERLLTSIVHSKLFILRFRWDYLDRPAKSATLCRDFRWRPASHETPG